MSKKKKKDKKKDSAEPESELQRLREENEMLRARLEKIHELAGELPGAGASRDDEDEEYDEMERDVDDLIAAGDGGRRVIVPPGADHS